MLKFFPLVSEKKKMMVLFLKINSSYIYIFNPNEMNLIYEINRAESRKSAFQNVNSEQK